MEYLIDIDAQIGRIMRWVEIGQKHLSLACLCNLQLMVADEATRLQAENERLRKALVEIAKGDGAFSSNPLQYGWDCIANMKQIAEDALQKAIEVADVPGSEVKGE